MTTRLALLMAVEQAAAVAQPDRQVDEQGVEVQRDGGRTRYWFP